MQQNEIAKEKFGLGWALYMDFLWPLQLNVFNLWKKKPKNIKKQINQFFIKNSQRKLSARNHILLEAKLILALLRVILHV